MKNPITTNRSFHPPTLPMALALALFAMCPSRSAIAAEMQTGLGRTSSSGWRQ